MSKIFKIRILPKSQEIILHFAKVYEEANKYRYTNSEKYIKILYELYKEEFVRRYEMLKSIGNNTDKISKTLNYISKRESIVEWLIDWCWTIDPRNPPIGLPSELPMIPWLQQIEFIEWFYNQYLNQRGGLVEKSRDMGATWLFCFIFVREWRWEEGFSAGIGSSKLTLVDEKENPKAIFAKIRHIINSQPKWWLPEWNEKYDKIANITNPINHSNLAGEGGDNIGRGDRRSVYLVDEKAYLEHPDMADAALSQTTNSQFDLSTPNGMNNFGQKRHSGRVDIFTFDWREDPRKDQNWYEEQKRILDPVTVAQEIDRDYHASVDNLFIPPQYINAAINRKLPDSGIISAGLDVAAGGKNRSALAISKGCSVKVKKYNFKNGVDLTYEAIRICNEEGVDYLTYDPIGVGHSVHSNIERTEVPIGFDCYPVGAGEGPSDLFYEEFGRKAKDVFQNAKTEWWYRVYVLFKNTWEYFEHGISHTTDEMITIENDPELINQLSSPLKKYKTNGIMTIETKEEMIARGIQSGDKADAFVMSRIPKNIGFNRVWATYNRNNFKPVNIDFDNIEPGMAQIFIVLILTKAGEIYGNFYFWGRKSRILRIYDEIICKNPIALSLGNEIRAKAGVAIKAEKSTNMPHVEKIFCNEEMVSGKSDWAYTLRKNALIRITQSCKYEESASQMLARTMFSRKQIIVDSEAVETNMQYKNWRIVDYKPETGYPLCQALCIAVTELKERGEFDDPKEIKPYYRAGTEVREKLKQKTLGTGAGVFVVGTSNNEYQYLTK